MYCSLWLPASVQYVYRTFPPPCGVGDNGVREPHQRSTLSWVSQKLEVYSVCIIISERIFKSVQNAFISILCNYTSGQGTGILDQRLSCLSFAVSLHMDNIFKVPLDVTGGVLPVTSRSGESDAAQS